MLFTGWGPIVVIVFVIIAFGAQSLFAHLTGDVRYLLNHPLTGVLIFAVAGIVGWFLGRFMNRKPIEVMELDRHGRKHVLKARHTIWFIPAEYWGPILFLLLTFIFFLKPD